MNRYKQYMDSVTVSDTLHEKLKNLEEPKKKTAAWKKYGAMAAALVLVAGLGAWGISGLGGRTELGESVPAIGESVTEPAIEPAASPLTDSKGQLTMGGYEVSDGEMVAYYMLPYIEYGEIEAPVEADIALPVGVTRRDLTGEELLALLGGETNLISHLKWGEYTVSAHAMVWPDGSMWLLYIHGSKGDTGLEHFSLEVSPGQLPPSCLYYEKSELNNIWERDVWAGSYDSLSGSSRRVSFMDEGYGYRFEISGFKAGEISELVSRLVRWILVDDGLTFEKEEPVSGTDEVTTMPYDPSVSTPPAEPDETGELPG